MLTLPFLFDTWDKVDKFAESKLVEPINSKLEEKGVKLIGITAFGMMDIAATKEINSIDDLKGLKFRIQPTPVFKKKCELLGINGMPIPYTELYTSLQQGIVDGVFNTSELMLMDKTAEVCGYVMDTNHMCGFIVHLMNKEWYDSLPEDLQKVVIDSINYACREERKRVRQRESEFTEKMKTEQNTKFIEITPDEKKRFIEALMPMHEDVKKTVGKDYMDKLYELLGFKGSST